MLVSVSLFRLFDNNKHHNFENLLLFEELHSDQSDHLEEKKDTVIIVDVKGAVNQPGVYVMVEGDRVFSAIEKANGFRDDANEKVINLAALLKDEMVIYVPFIGEEVEDVVNVGLSTDVDHNRINVNTATSEELQLIPGIGPAKAAAIIQYRDEHGRFEAVEDLVRVTGIGNKTMDSMREYITVK
ncbi:MAG: helix-hairpin-helix domain-containing protein [Bacillaceae bacterium]|nr:helix-hairpin-helix domain-containing protein [Bacillaceae bacterium]